MKNLLRLIGLAFALVCLSVSSNAHAQGLGVLQTDAAITKAFHNQGTFSTTTNYAANDVVNVGGTTLYYAPVAIAASTTAPPGGAWVVLGGGTTGTGGTVLINGVSCATGSACSLNPSVVGADSSGAAAAAQAAAIAASLQKTQNLSDLVSASAARGNLGLGTAATMSSAAFDAAGMAAAAQSAAEAASDPVGAAAAAQSAAVASSLQKANNLSDVANAATARASLGLGTAAIKNVVGSNAGGICPIASTAITSGHGLVADANGCPSDMGVAPAAVGTAGQLPISQGPSTGYSPQTVSGDCTISSTGVLTCARADQTTNTPVSGLLTGDGITLAVAGGVARAGALNTFDPDVMATGINTTLCQFNGTLTVSSSGTTLTISGVTGQLYAGAVITVGGTSATVYTQLTGAAGGAGTYQATATTTISGTGSFALQDTSGFECAAHNAISYYATSAGHQTGIVRAHGSSYALPTPLYFPQRSYNGNSVAIRGELGCTITATAVMPFMISIAQASPNAAAPEFTRCNLNGAYLAQGGLSFDGTFNSLVEHVDIYNIDYKGGLGNSNFIGTCRSCGNQHWNDLNGGTGTAGFVGTLAEVKVNLTTTATTSYSIASNVITVVTPNSLAAGYTVQLQGFPTSTFLNGVYLKVSSATSSQFTAPFTYANVASTSEAGNVVGGLVTGLSIGQKAYAISTSGGTGGTSGTYNFTTAAGAGACNKSPNNTGTYPSGTVVVSGGTYTTWNVTNKGAWCDGNQLTINVAGTPGVTGATNTISFDSGMRGIGLTHAQSLAQGLSDSLDAYGNPSVPHIYYYGGGTGNQLKPCQVNPTQYQNTNSGGANYNPQLALQQVSEPTFAFDANGNPTSITYTGTHNEVDCAPPMYAYINTGSTLATLIDYEASDGGGGGGSGWWLTGGALSCVNFTGGNPQMHDIHGQCPIGTQWSSGVGLDFGQEIDSNLIAGVQVLSSTVKIDHLWYGYNGEYPGAVAAAVATTNSSQNSQITNTQCSGLPGDAADFLPFTNYGGAFNTINPVFMNGQTIRDWAHCSTESNLAQELINERTTARASDGSQAALTLTTTGTSGPATLSANGALNIPQYSGGSSAGIYTSGTGSALTVGVGPYSFAPGYTFECYDATPTTGTSNCVVKIGAGGGQFLVQDNSGNLLFQINQYGAGQINSSFQAQILQTQLDSVTSSATPTFSSGNGRSRLVLSANVTSSTLAAGNDGAQKCIEIVQGSTAYTFTWPTTTVGGGTVGTTVNKRNVQCFEYSNADSLWLATGPMVTNE